MDFMCKHVSRDDISLEFINQHFMMSISGCGKSIGFVKFVNCSQVEIICESVSIELIFKQRQFIVWKRIFFHSPQSFYYCFDCVAITGSVISFKTLKQKKYSIHSIFFSSFS